MVVLNEDFDDRGDDCADWKLVGLMWFLLYNGCVVGLSISGAKGQGGNFRTFH